MPEGGRLRRRHESHGVYCLGCRWALMALLYVAGVMNLFWVAVISVAVLIEKVVPRGDLVGRIAGAQPDRCRRAYHNPGSGHGLTIRLTCLAWYNFGVVNIRTALILLVVVALIVLPALAMADSHCAAMGSGPCGVPACVDGPATSAFTVPLVIGFCIPECAHPASPSLTLPELPPKSLLLSA